MEVKLYLAGVDLGGSYIKAGIVDSGGKILAKGQVATMADQGATAVILRIKALLERLLWEQGLTFADLQGAGVGIPGSVDTDSGLVKLAPNLGWRDYPARAELVKALKVPVIVDNDAHVATLGEKWQGAGRGFASLLMVTIGTGIGSGLIINNEIQRGHFGFGAELGHYKIAHEKRRCHCGGRGCLETVASATAILRTFREGLACGCSSLLKDSPALEARQVVEAAAQGDVLARRVLERAVRHLALALANISLTIGPELIIIGGGLAQAGELILEPLRKHLQAYLGVWQVKPLPLVAAQLGNDAGVIGAAYLALSENCNQDM
ncbi:MAG: ROK family glucokinase [Clostridia bacterium]|nr:ROK family glucokinase [Clostridia bacterium]